LPTDIHAGNPTLGTALRGHANSLGLIRLVLAFAVIFDHASPLGGFGPDFGGAYTLQQASIGSLAVGGFFAISGYLIVKSGMSADVLQFMWRRFLRIFPAFWAVLIVVAFVVGPLIWIADGHELGAYFQTGPGGPFAYLASNWTLTINAFGILDMFQNTTPYGLAVGGSSVNGSLWTLSYEWTCYLIIAIFVASAVLKKARILVPVLTGFFLIAQIVQTSGAGSVGSVLPFLANPTSITLTLTFLLGACLGVYSKSIPYDDRLGIFAGIVMILTLRYGGFSTIGTIAAVYFIMYLGARLPAVFHRVGSKNDYSYGVYIYGFVVQQVLAYMGVYAWGYFPYVVIACLITLGLAWLSWHGIEKRAMSLKDRGPGRGLAWWASAARSRFTRKPSEAAMPSNSIVSRNSDGPLEPPAARSSQT
jgi:peptidoglycan/LPS O-acetylase OafA/YrhL